jgi:hypothetical protein
VRPAAGERAHRGLRGGGGGLRATAALAVPAALLGLAASTAAGAATIPTRVDRFSPVSQRDLDAALITPADLPAGWAAVPGAAGLDESPICGRLPLRAGVQLQARAILARARALPILQERVVLSARAGARRAVRALAAAARCPSFVVARDGRRATWTLRRLPDPRPAGVALRMASGPLVGDVVVLRRGSFLYGLSIIDRGVPDVALERRLLAVARARLARLAG